jgi:hypothetical protein
VAGKSEFPNPNPSKLNYTHKYNTLEYI